MSVVKVAEAYARHGDEREMVSRAIQQIASKTKLADGCGDSDSRCMEGIREPMGYRAAMRGRRRVSRGCAWVGTLRCASWAVVVSVGGGDETAETGGCERATTGMINSRRTRRGEREASERGGGSAVGTRSLIERLVGRDVGVGCC